MGDEDMIQANVSFEICSLLILIIVFFHMNMKKHVKNFANKFFIWFTLCGVIDVVLDIVTTVMLENPTIYSENLRMIALEFFYLFQLLLPYLLFLYILSLRDALNKKGIVPIVISSLVTFVMSFLAVTNAVTGLYFRFLPNGERTFGVFYLGLYVYALVYLAVIVIDATVHRKKIKQRYFIVVWEFALISGVSVVLQLLMPNVMLTGAGVAISIIVLMITVQNPNNVQDRLTGVFSLEGMQETLSEYQSNGRSYGMIVIAIDNLKRINYIFGMEYGDELLRKVAEQLKTIANPENVFRFIGDRFVLVLSEEKQYQEAFKQAVAYFQKPIKIHLAEVSVSACICAFPIADNYGSVAEISSFMEFSVEAAKSHGVGTVLAVDDEMRQKYYRRRMIESYLIVAIRKNLFEVHYQPIYSVAEHRFTGMEALVRLSHPSLGAISPAEFIPIAEKSGIVAQIDHLAFERTCQFISTHREVLDTFTNIKFNISPADLMDINLCDRIEEMLKKYELEAKIFQFEITETTATLYTEHVSKWAERIKAMGADLCLDDFGSGYANLDSVMTFPYRIIKIDRSMLLAAMNSQKGAELYKGTVILLRMLGYQIVAEGAETEEQIQFLTSLHVEYIQGYYYSRPVPEKGILSLTEM